MDRIMQNKIRQGLASTYGESNVHMFFDCANILFEVLQGTQFSLSQAESLIAAEEAVPKWLDNTSLTCIKPSKGDCYPCSMKQPIVNLLKNKLEGSISNRRSVLACLLMCSAIKIRYECPVITESETACPLESKNTNEQ